MTVLTETIKTATVLNAHGENGVWEKTKTHTNNRSTKCRKGNLDGRFQQLGYQKAPHEKQRKRLSVQDI